MAQSYHIHEVESMPFETQSSPPLESSWAHLPGPPLGPPLGPPPGPSLGPPWAHLGLSLLGLIVPPLGPWALGSWALGPGAAKTITAT